MEIDKKNNLKNLAQSHSIFQDVRARVASMASTSINEIRPSNAQAQPHMQPDMYNIVDTIIRQYDESPMYIQMSIREQFSESLTRMYDDIMSLPY